MMMSELVAAVGRDANLSCDQARQAVAAMLRFLTARLPSALAGELHARLEDAPEAAERVDAPAAPLP